MKLIESSSGQECKSPQVHHKDIWSSYFELHNAWKSLYDGPVLDSTGHKYKDGRSGKVEAVG